MTMKFKYIILFFSMLCLIIGCSQDGLEITDDSQTSIFTEPVFKIQGTLGLDPMNIQAGVDSFYMYTDYELNNSGNYVLSGKFAAEEGASSTRDEELKFSIIPVNSSTYPTPSIDAISDTEFTYGTNVTGYLYVFSNVFLSSLGSVPDWYFWSFDFNQTYNTSSAEYFRADDTPFSANLTLGETDGCSANTSGWVSPDIDSDSTFILDLSFFTNPDSNTIEFVVENPDVTVEWSTASAALSSGDTFSYDLTQISSGFSTELTVNAFNQYGKMATNFIDIAYINGQEFEVCLTKFEYEVIDLSATQDLSSSVIIEYQKDGRKYSSAFDEQPLESFISISEVEDFRINENGLPTYKCKVNFNVLLFNIDTGQSRPFVGEGYIGIAHPN